MDVALPTEMERLAGELEFGEPWEVRELGLSDGRLLARFTLIAVFEAGLILGHHSKPRVQSMLWDDVTAYYTGGTRKTVNGGHRSTTHTHRFRLRNGEEVNLIGVSTPNQTSALADFSAVAGPIVTARVWPGIAAAVDAGEPVEFAGLLVGPLGFQERRRILPWDDVGRIEIVDGAVRIHEQGKRFFSTWGRFAVDRLPNLDAFMALVDEYQAPE